MLSSLLIPPWSVLKIGYPMKTIRMIDWVSYSFKSLISFFYYTNLKVDFFFYLNDFLSFYYVLFFQELIVEAVNKYSRQLNTVKANYVKETFDDINLELEKSKNTWRMTKEFTILSSFGVHFYILIFFYYW